jgi:mono/diheme cytochrome c family protein
MSASQLRIARRAVLAVLAVAAMGEASLSNPVNYQLPPETAAFRPGPNLDVMLANCAACHSSDYISTQPQGPRFKREFWQAEVTKMIKVYGAPIDDADVGKIVDYLAATYGAP